MHTSVEQIKDLTIISVDGRIDSLTAPTFEEDVCAFIDKSDTNVVINFQAVEYISSAGLRALLIIAKKGRETNRQIAISGMNENILDVIRITGFLGFFKTFPDIRSASENPTW